MILNSSPYLCQGAPLHCALCNAPFIVEDEHIKCWKGGDNRYYCCPEHADFGLEKLLAALVPLGRKAS
jgi:hypothetical protein